MAKHFLARKKTRLSVVRTQERIARVLDLCLKNQKVIDHLKLSDELKPGGAHA